MADNLGNLGNYSIGIAVEMDSLVSSLKEVTTAIKDATNTITSNFSQISSSISKNSKTAETSLQGIGLRAASVAKSIGASWGLEKTEIDNLTAQIVADSNKIIVAKNAAAKVPISASRLNTMGKNIVESRPQPINSPNFTLAAEEYKSATGSSKSIEQLSSSFEKAAISSQHMKAATESAGLSFTALQAAAGETANKITMLDRFTKALTTTLRYVVSYQLIQWFQQATVGSMIFAGQLEKMRMEFDTLTKNASATGAMFRELQQYAFVSPFQIQPLAENAKKLLAVGFATNEVVPILRKLGDVAMGDEDKLNRLTNAYERVSSKGRASLRELNMFIYAGIPIIQELSKNMGVTGSKIYEMVSKGQIGFSQVDEALNTLTGDSGKFHNMMLNQAKTLPGMWSILSDQVNLTSANITTLFLPSIKKAVQGMIDFTSFTFNSTVKLHDWVASHPKLTAAILDTTKAVIALSIGIGILNNEAIMKLITQSIPALISSAVLFTANLLPNLVAWTTTLGVVLMEQVWTAMAAVTGACGGLALSEELATAATNTLAAAATVLEAVLGLALLTAISVLATEFIFNFGNIRKVVGEDIQQIIEDLKLLMKGIQLAGSGIGDFTKDIFTGNFTKLGDDAEKAYAGLSQAGTQAGYAIQDSGKVMNDTLSVTIKNFKNLGKITTPTDIAKLTQQSLKSLHPDSTKDSGGNARNSTADITHKKEMDNIEKAAESRHKSTMRELQDADVAASMEDSIRRKLIEEGYSEYSQYFDKLLSIRVERAKKENDIRQKNEDNLQKDLQTIQIDTDEKINSLKRSKSRNAAAAMVAVAKQAAAEEKELKELYAKNTFDELTQLNKTYKSKELAYNIEMAKKYQLEFEDLEIESATARATNTLEIDKESLEHRHNLGLTSTKQYYEDLIKLQEEENKIAQDSISKTMQNKSAKDPNYKPGYIDYEKDNEKYIEAVADGNRKIQALNDKMSEDMKQKFTEAFRSINQGFSDAIGDMVTGLSTFSDGITSITTAIQRGFSQMISKMLQDWIQDLTVMMLEWVAKHATMAAANLMLRGVTTGSAAAIQGANVLTGLSNMALAASHKLVGAGAGVQAGAQTISTGTTVAQTAASAVATPVQANLAKATALTASQIIALAIFGPFAALGLLLLGAAGSIAAPGIAAVGAAATLAAPGLAILTLLVQSLSTMFRNMAIALVTAAITLPLIAIGALLAAPALLLMSAAMLIAGTIAGLMAPLIAAFAVASAAASVAGIPIIGAALAPAAALATGTAIAAGTMIASFDVGAENIPRDMFAQVHKGERILTNQENSKFTNFLDNSHKQQGGSDENHYHFSIEATDPKSFLKQIDSVTDRIVANVEARRRRFK